jgi:hypothetical protein
MTHPKHLHPPRFVFHGNASGVSAHIRRPQDRILAVQASCALPAIGGHCEDAVGPTKLDKWVSFDSASTYAHGDYVNADQGLATTLPAAQGGIAFHEAVTETRVSARVLGLVILGRVHIAELAIGLISRSVLERNQPPIRLEDNVLEGVRIDDAKLKITLAQDFYCLHDTKNKLRDAHDRGLSEHHARMFLPSVPGEEEIKGFPEANGTVKCTLVQDICWDGPEHPTAKIHGHVVVVPHFGKIYFGEMLITGDSRRLTMVRFQLGSDDGGEVTAGDGQTNGTTYPPTGG